MEPPGAGRYGSGTAKARVMSSCQRPASLRPVVCTIRRHIVPSDSIWVTTTLISPVCACARRAESAGQPFPASRANSKIGCGSDRTQRDQPPGTATHTLPIWTAMTSGASMTTVAPIRLLRCFVAIAGELAHTSVRWTGQRGWTAQVPGGGGWQRGVADRAAGAAGVPMPLDA